MKKHLTRKDRKARLVHHLKSIKEIEKKKLQPIVADHYNLFDSVYAKFSAGAKLKCQGIYESVFCKERSLKNE